MRHAAALLAVAALAGCGTGRPAPSAAEVAPAGTYALIQGRSTVELERALRFLPEGAEVRRLLARALAVTGAGPRPTLAVLDPAGSEAVALTPATIDGLRLPHARVRGWTVFSRRRSAVEVVRRARARLADTAWYRPARGDLTLVRRGRTVTATVRGDRVFATRSEVPAGRDATHPLAASIPRDAVAAAAFHDGARVLGTLPFRGRLRAGLGLDPATLAAAAPADGALYARPAVPAATVTLLAAGTRAPDARRVVRELAPHAPAGVPGVVGGLAATDVPLGPVDLFYGTTGKLTFVTDDPDATLAPRGGALAPDGLPDETTAWAYLDTARGLPALESLAALAGTRLAPGFVRKLAGIRTLLAFRTRGALTVVVR